MNAGPTLLALCKAAEVTDEVPLRCDIDGVSYAVFRCDGEYFVLDDRCSHGPGSLSEGYVEGYEVECPFHQGRFDMRTGCAVAAPCWEPVRTWPVQVVDDMVAIEPAQARLCSE